MRLREIAFNNLKRRRSKAAFLLAGLMVGVAAVVSLTTITMTMSRDIEEKLDRFGANILISPKTEGLSLSYGGLTLGGVNYTVKEISAEEVDRIDEIENRANIKVVSPKTLGVVRIDERPVLLAGIDPAKELSLKKWWQVTGGLPEGDRQVTAGSRAAINLGLEMGSEVDIQGETFTVTGLLTETGSPDDELLFSTIPAAQGLLGKEGLYSMVEVSALCRDCPVEDIVNQISAKMPGARITAVQQVVKSKMQALDHLKKFSAGVSAAVLLVGALMVLVTMMGSVNERMREIGIFRAIGFRRSHIIRIILLEATIVSTLAGLTGYLAGLLIARFSLPFFMEGEAAAMYMHPGLLGAAVALSLGIGLFASAYPALKATRLAPGEALRILQ
jgi:putative ABC transport system permease protein